MERFMLSLATLLKRPMVMGLSANAFKALFREPQSRRSGKMGTAATVPT